MSFVFVLSTFPIRRSVEMLYAVPLVLCNAYFALHPVTLCNLLISTPAICRNVDQVLLPIT